MRGRSRLDGLRQALEEGELDMDVERLGLQGREAVQNAQEGLAHGRQMLQALLQTEVAQVVRADLAAQEGGELLVLLEEGTFPVGAEDMVPMLNLLQGSPELALLAARDAKAEDLREAVRGPTQNPQLAGALEEAMNRKMTFEDKIAAVFHLGDGIKAPQIQWRRPPGGKTSGPGPASSIPVAPG